MEKKIEMSWEKFKVLILVSGIISYGLGLITVMFIEWFGVLMTGILFHPIAVFYVWKKYSNDFLKKGIKK